MLETMSDHYNKLLGLGEANLFLGKQKDENIDLLLAIIKRHGLEEDVGVRLLHKHNDIYLHEIMAEDYIIDDLGFALVTKARLSSEVGDKYAPNSWILSDDGFVPMEFSLTKLVNNHNINLIDNKAFFDDLAAEIRNLGLSTIIGPSLLGSEFIESNRPPGSSMMIELTAMDERANVLRFMGSTIMPKGTSIETHWCISGDEKESGDKNIIRICKKICPEIQNPPVHQGTSIHKQE